MRDDLAWGKAFEQFLSKTGLTQAQFVNAVSQLSLHLIDAEQAALSKAGIELQPALSDAVITRYKKGQAIPRQRERHLSLIWALQRLHGIESGTEANQWLELGGEGWLTLDEGKTIFGDKYASAHANTPQSEESGQQSSWLADLLHRTQADSQRMLGLLADLLQKDTEASNRSQMLQKVHRVWIDGVLKHSLHHQVMINLMVRERSDQVEGSPWRAIIRAPAVADDCLDPKETVNALFAASQQKLLILGEPGAGKTTMLLDLARRLILQAKAEPTLPIPVVVHLATWNVEKRPMVEWLQYELRTKYYVPGKIAHDWVMNDAMILLFDGLDEVDPAYRQTCIRAINQFSEDHPVGIVVCCRTADYAAITPAIKLKLEGALQLQPLTRQQIDQYLQQVNFERLLDEPLLQMNRLLYELAASPLMLHTIIRAYQALSAEDLRLLASLDAQRSYLFNQYIQRMFYEHRTINQPFSEATTKRWLIWLAKQMLQQSLSPFLIEQIQPSWLPTPSRRCVYMLISRLFIGISGAVLGGLLVGVGFGIFFHDMREGLLRGLVEGLLSGILGGIMIGVADAIRANSPLDRPIISQSKGSRYWQMALYIATISLCVGISVWLGIGFILGHFNWLGFSLRFWLYEGSMVGLLVGLCFGLIFGFRAPSNQKLLRADIEPIEYIAWSTSGALTGCIYGIAVGLISGFLLSYADNESVPLIIIFGATNVYIITVFTLVIVGLIFGGLTGRIIQESATPNQGIWLSLRNTLQIGSSVGVVCGLIGAFIGRMGSTSLTNVLAFGVYGALVGVLASLWYGGFDVLKHITLRLLLAYEGFMPINYAYFLDYAVERIFLRRVGGGYIFIHRLLMEHFATMQE